jgi:hypothetical protein
VAGQLSSEGERVAPFSVLCSIHNRADRPG